MDRGCCKSRLFSRITHSSTGCYSEHFWPTQPRHRNIAKQNLSLPNDTRCLWI